VASRTDRQTDGPAPALSDDHQELAVISVSCLFRLKVNDLGEYGGLASFAIVVAEVSDTKVSDTKVSDTKVSDTKVSDTKVLRRDLSRNPPRAWRVMDTPIEC